MKTNKTFALVSALTLMIAAQPVYGMQNFNSGLNQVKETLKTNRLAQVAGVITLASLLTNKPKYMVLSGPALVYMSATPEQRAYALQALKNNWKPLAGFAALIGIAGFSYGLLQQYIKKLPKSETPQILDKKLTITTIRKTKNETIQQTPDYKENQNQRNELVKTTAESLVKIIQEEINKLEQQENQTLQKDAEEMKEFQNWIEKIDEQDPKAIESMKPLSTKDVYIGSLKKLATSKLALEFFKTPKFFNKQADLNITSDALLYNNMHVWQTAKDSCFEETVKNWYTKHNIEIN